METKSHIEEDLPRNTNPDEVGKTEPAKVVKSQEKIKINESGFGREQGQTPADEHIEINDTDVRDQNDSTTDWDAENSKTGRHK